MSRRYGRSRFDFLTSREFSEEEILNRIKRWVNMLWSNDRLARTVVDIESEQAYIEQMRQRYVFPDYLSLVGSPSESDFNESGELKSRRKAELMLIGTFDWQGFLISRPVSTQDDQFPDDGWFVALEAHTNELSFENFFFPFNKIKKQRLERYLVSQTRELKNAHRVAFKDGNVFNCHPDNFEIRGQGGRPMLCVYCRKKTTKDMSVRIKVQGSYDRYCLTCVEKIADS